jgi:hypothetical protein
MIPPKALEKIEKRIARIGQWRYRLIAEVTLDMAETMEHFRTPPRLSYRPVPVGTEWGKEWGSAWFRGKITIPS